MSNIDDLMSKMEEVLAVTKASLAKSIALEEQVESLKREVSALHDRLTYREKVIVGWKEIATYCGYESVSWAQERARESFDRLPVLQEGNRIVAFASALDAYKARRLATRKVARLVPRETEENPS